MKSKKRIQQLNEKRATKAARINRPGGKSTYATKKAAGGSKYWEKIAPLLEAENLALAIRQAGSGRRLINVYAQ